MDIEQLREFALTLPKATEDMPYGEGWLVFRIEGKIFLHLRLDTAEATCAVKLEPEYGEELRMHYEGVQPAYHLNKRHWSDLYLDTLDNSFVEALVRRSYSIVVAKLPKRIRESISGVVD